MLSPSTVASNSGQCKFTAHYIINRIVAAKKNSKGEAMQIILHSTRADETQTYDAVKDMCT